MASSTSLGPFPQPVQWPPDRQHIAGYLSRKALPIKRNDAEPLTRNDIQYDLLDFIFSDSRAVFSSPEPGPNVTFRELYISALYNSGRCSKVLKEKMAETPAFAIELAKISLLTNVGRINTTMAFFPEMKTALRTYHPVPSLQKTDGNAQDAPRIKNCLKAALLPSELKSIPPTTPEEILERSRAGQIPPTSVVNLIFVLANHAAPLGPVHFESFNFLELFLPSSYSSADRGRAFLWLMFHYLERPTIHNPYHDDFSRTHLRKVPRLRRLTDGEHEGENVDTPEEIAWGLRMSAMRNTFLKRLVSSTEEERRIQKSNPGPSPARVTDYDRSHRRSRRAQKETFHPPFSPEPDVVHPDLHLARGTPSMQAQVTHNSPPHPPPPPPPLPSHSRTMLQQAWHVVNTTDPLADSDEECADEHLRLDYYRRLLVLNRLRAHRGHSPTLEAAPPPPRASLMQLPPLRSLADNPSLQSSRRGSTEMASGGARFQPVESWD